MPAPSSNEWRVRQPEADKLATRPDVLIARRAAGAWGVLSLDELVACGLSRNAVMNRVRNGRLHPVHRGVYAVGHADLPLEGRFLAAVKACRTGVLSHFSAAALWGFIPWEERYPEVTVVGASRPVQSAIRVHRTTRLDVDDRARHHGIPLTSPARTLLDLAATLDHRPLRAATRRAQSLHRVNVRQLADALARHGRRRGTARLAQIIATGPAPTRSELEDVVRDLILRGGHVHPTSCAVRRRRPEDGPRLPLAAAAPGPRGRRRSVARQPARARRRRRAPGAARGSRRAGAARHLGAGDHPSEPHARPAASGGCALRGAADDQHQPAQEGATDHIAGAAVTQDPLTGPRRRRRALGRRRRHLAWWQDAHTP
jgi:predicted transcriptional regulator of viral defense system